ncbi:uncharacterized protein K489DRAFT_417184 [Dissoconium aciculare CBS 342.82]|uniref:Uncharacterized protein n=1 Tax=Dissoconium aciculare CBS 342.82 TaxID=1314786 RepID=A0A6J3LZ30_9PEZI|nr:uncharacterized protein K489DRAFT_417184 [Dissoconium aciculare CBS 342.82]KAF1819892.1 hypothetical protein K489DRAFT_417184 [Dissoconium aciculare CBS 342.82]
MVSLKQLLALAACSAVALAQSAADVKDPDAKAPSVKIDVTTTFPDAEVFGIKLVNGRPTRALFQVVNNEPEPIVVLVATGTLLTTEGALGAPNPPEILRNLTVTKYSTVIPPKSTETVQYSFSEIMNPRDVTLDLKLLVQARESIFTLGVYKESVSVVEAPFSILDPQVIFLYLILAGVFGGTVYAIYNIWIKDLLPQKKRGGKGGERAKRSTTGQKPVDPKDQVAVEGADGPAVTTGSKGYDESWIPEGHLSKPAGKRAGGGKTKSKAT